MSLNLIDQAAQRKRINELLSNPVESAKELESLRQQLASRDAEISELKKDAVRYRLVREYMVSERTDLDDEFVSACSTNEPEKLDAFVDEVLAP